MKRKDFVSLTGLTSLGFIFPPKVIGKLTVEIDGKLVTVTSIGDVEHDQKNDRSNAKHAESDSFKRCAMKLGLGLHLWAGEEYYLDKQLDKKEIGKKTKLQSA